MKTVGIVFFVLSGICVALGFTMQTTASYSDTLNIGLLNDQQNLINLGGYMLIAGAVFFAGGSLIEAIRGAEESKLEMGIDRFASPDSHPVDAAS